MRFRRLVWIAVMAVVVASVANAATRATEPPDRVRVAEVGGALTASLPASVLLTLSPPADYARHAQAPDRGDWVGPEYWSSGRRELGGRAAINWTVRFDGTAPTSEAAARRGLTRGWDETLHGGVSVPHVVLGRTIGTIDGDFVLTVSGRPNDASHELAMAFAVAPRLYAVVDFLLTSPSSSSAGPSGDYVVAGVVPASTWNRGQALRSMTGVRIDGNLPPTRVSARPTAGGRLVRGTLVDAFRHPVLRTEVALEVLRAGSWRRVTSTKTDLTGAYSIRIGRRAQYRVVAGLGNAAVASATVDAGR